MSRNSFEDDNLSVIEKEKVSFKEPSLYDVIFLNDDETTIYFVELVLEKYFNKSCEEASFITQKIDKEGSAVAGTYTKEIAEMKIFEVVKFARNNGFPLMLIMEKNG